MFITFAINSLNTTKNILNNNMFLEPKKIRSPYTGETVMPNITTHTYDGKTYEQVSYNDPVTGNLIKKGIVSIKDAQTGQVIQDYTNNNINSIQNLTYRT
jgi:hypothetical protein